MHTLIIDGYNVIHAIPQLEEMLDESLEAARAGLVQFMSDFNKSRKDINRTYVVFDGKAELYDEEEHAAAGIIVIYTRKGTDADKKIVDIIREAPEPADITVVSNDNFVYNNSRALGARVKSVEEFRRMF